LRALQGQLLHDCLQRRLHALELAANLGVTGLLVCKDGSHDQTWPAISRSVSPTASVRHDASRAWLTICPRAR